MPYLVVETSQSRAEHRHPIERRITSIGSGEDNDIRIVDRGVADTHAVLQMDARRFVIQALAADADLTVRGRKVRQHVLEDGDEVSIGSARLRFELFDRARSDAELRTRQDAASYRRILELSRTLLGAWEIDALLTSVTDAVVELTGAERGFLLLVEDNEASVRVARDLKGQPIADPEAELSDSIVATTMKERRPILIADALHDQRFGGSHSVVSLRLSSVLCVPLLDRDRVLGVIYLGSSNHVNLFTHEQLDLITVFAAQVSLIIARSLALDELKATNRSLREEIAAIRFGSVIGASPSMREIYRRVEKVAGTDVTVLIEGETGTGKEMIAKEIHGRSERRAGPFVTINCGAIPAPLLESELFGHARGAFTGAVSARVGKFQAAHGGTIFLDEIGDLPLALQVKILRVLQERVVTRVGDAHEERVDIRILAATHRDLAAMVRAGTFREDLFFRLNVVSLHLPPLRERGDDVVWLARFLLERYHDELKVPARRFSAEAIRAIRSFDWPGNIRQLENHIKKALILAEHDEIGPEDLDLATNGAAGGRTLVEAREEWQRRYIAEALARHDGNRTRTARELGVDPRTIFRFLEREQAREGGPDEDVT
jgi:transcriptional regulator with GAF, ATPase, and Fis domain